MTLTSVLLVDLLGLEKLTNSFGILLLFQGRNPVCALSVRRYVCSYFSLRKLVSVSRALIGSFCLCLRHFLFAQKSPIINVPSSPNIDGDWD